MIVIGTPIYVLFMRLIQWGGEYFYIYLFAAYVLILLIFMHIVPNWILPLFNKYSDLEDGTLKEKITALANKLNFPLTKIYIVDHSKRSSHSNAYFYGFGRDKRIVLFDTLV
jgi:STE24 endopeptidase